MSSYPQLLYYLSLCWLEEKMTIPCARRLERRKRKRKAKYFYYKLHLVFSLEKVSLNMSRIICVNKPFMQYGPLCRRENAYHVEVVLDCGATAAEGAQTMTRATTRAKAGEKRD